MRLSLLLMGCAILTPSTPGFSFEQVEISSLGTYAPVPKTEGGAPIEIDEVSDAQLQALFKEVASLPGIPYGSPDGCFARAHRIAQILESKGVKTGKLFVHGRLHLRPKACPQMLKGVEFHVAPLLYRKTSRGRELVVLDPAVFDKPVPLLEWMAKLSDPGKKVWLNYTSRFQYKDVGPTADHYRNDDTRLMNGDLRMYTDQQDELRAQCAQIGQASQGSVKLKGD